MSVTTRGRGRGGVAAWLAIGTTGLALALAGCAGNSGGDGAAADQNIAGTSAADSYNNSAAVQTGGKITWAIEKPVQNWNLLSTDTRFDSGQVLNGVYPDTFIANPSYAVTMNSDLLTSASETSSNPETVTYQVKPNASWSDGTPINADDFVYTWQVQNGTDPNIPAASTTGFSQIASVTGSHAGKTVTVVFKGVFPDWKSLFSPLYPAHVAEEHGGGEASFAWFSANPPTISGGPFEVQSVSADQTSVTLQRNAKYYGAQPKLDQVVFRVITDSRQEPTALQNREVDGIYPQPEVGLVTQLKDMGSKISYKIDSGLSFEHIDFNLKNAALGNATWGKTLRTAMFTAFHRDDLIAKTIKQFQPSATALDNRMLVANQQGYQDDVTKYDLGSGDVVKARQELAAAGFKNATTGGQLTAPDGTAIPAFSMKYTVGDPIRQNTCALFAAAMSNLGITVDVSPTDDLGATLTQSGTGYTYDIVDFAWVATPFPASASQPIYTTGGGDNFGGYSNKNVDAWLNGAASTTDPATQISDLNKADQQITQDAYTLPLYQKPTLLAFYPDLGNVRDNTASIGPTYNLQDWGLKGAAS
jgi:peptide/nickel transport system substrate-binding protein